jgi:F-type H+-transporting ATPase subunit alpha
MVAEWDRALAESLDRLAQQAGEVRLEPRLQDLGKVRQLGDGVALVEGLAEVLVDEVVTFAAGVQGQVFDLDRDLAGVILFGPEQSIQVGSSVFRTGRPPTMPVGEALLGRVVDSLGRPRDALGPIQAGEQRLVDQEAPGPLERQPVTSPLLTGIKAVDAAIPIGRGQRELILGDRETGKTSIALDAVINQRDGDVVCVYVGIGKKRTDIVEVVEELRRNDALGHCAVVVADAEEPPALRYLAPYAGCSLAEWFAYQGRHALIVYDDLSRHADAYRELSLILRRPPGREAYPGDIFSIHARLVERAFKLGDALGGGSITALPIAETQQGNIAGFIPTNLISMTDGQLFLDRTLFTQGQLPAIDIGRSVSRVGRDAQPGAMRHVAADLRLQVAQYEEVKGFARFGAILDEATRRQIERGRRLLAVLAQDERNVIPLPVLVAELWALNTGLLDDVDADDVGRFEARLRAASGDFAHLARQVENSPTVDEALAQDLARWVAQAKQQR